MMRSYTLVLLNVGITSDLLQKAQIKQAFVTIWIKSHIDVIRLIETKKPQMVY